VEIDARSDRAQQIIEIVRNAGAEPPDRLELATLRDLFLHRIVMSKQQEAAPDLNAISIAEHLLRDGHPVDDGAVATLQVLDHEGTVLMLEDARMHAGDERILDLHVGLLAAAERELSSDRVLVPSELACQHDDACLLLLLGEASLRENVAPCYFGGIVPRHRMSRLPQAH